MSAFSSLETFYKLDERRRRSAQVDYGWWALGNDSFNIFWIRDTGELIAVRHGDPPEEIGTVTHGNGIRHLANERFRVCVLAKIDDQADVDDLLMGWREECAIPDSIYWIVGRLAEQEPILVNSPYLTRSEAAEYAKVSTRTIYRVIKSGELEAVGSGAVTRIKPEWIDQWLRNRANHGEDG